MSFKKAAIFAVAALLAVSLSACVKKGGNNAAESKESELVRLTEEEVTFTYWVRNDNPDSVANYADAAVYQILREKTGVNIQFLHPVGDETLDLLFASDDLPDIIETVNRNAIPNGADQSIEDGMIIRLNELIDEYAPNFKKARLSDPEAEMLTISDGGNIYAFPKLLDGEEDAWSGPMIRKDLLDKLNLDVPTTIPEWYEVLKAFKEDGIEVPLLLNGGWDTMQEFGSFIGAWDVNKRFYRTEDGKVAYGPIQPGYKDFLATFNKWHKEGLINIDFDNNLRGEYLTSGKVGASIASEGYGSYETVAAPYPKLTKDSKVRFRQKNWRNRGYEAYITKECPDPVLAVKWFDLHYTREGSDLFNYGVAIDNPYGFDGGNFYWYKGPEIEQAYKEAGLEVPEEVKERGFPIATEEMSNGEVAYWAMINKYKIDNAPYYKNTRVVIAKNLDTIINKNYKIWTQADSSGMLPPYTMNPAESKEVNEIMGPINSYVNDMFYKFIRGEESLDKWDEYVRTIKEMNIDRAVEIHQAAYDRMVSRVTSK